LRRPWGPRRGVGRRLACRGVGPEKLEIKIATWDQIDQAAQPGTIFATNSSSYPSRLMAENVHDKSRLCNMHFYMPPDINAVDLMSDGQTDRGLLDTLLAVLPEFGVYPFEARKDHRLHLQPHLGRHQA